MTLEERFKEYVSMFGWTYSEQASIHSLIGVAQKEVLDDLEKTFKAFTGDAYVTSLLQSLREKYE